VSAREEILGESERLERERKAQRVALLRKQQLAQDQFDEIRRKERSLILGEAQQLPSAMSLPCSICVTKNLHRPSPFLPGRNRFPGSPDDNLGKYRVTAPPPRAGI
jgi:hypothetical protein